MEWFDEMRRRLRVLFRREEFHRDLEEEMRFHLEMQAEENQQSGLDAEEARYAARRQFGNATGLREASRDVWGWGSFERLCQDLRFAGRMLRKNPAFTAVAVLTLALGIGANTAVFSVVNAVLLRPLPLHDPGRLVMLWETWNVGGGQRINVSGADLIAWKEQARSFEDMAAFTGGRSATLRINGEQVDLRGVASVTANFFDEVGVRPALGRAFRPDDEGRIAILGHGLWQRLGGTRDLIGGVMSFYGEPYTVVGIMPAEFSFPGDAELWFLLSDKDLRSTGPGNYNYHVIGRLKPGVTIVQAQTEMDLIAARLRQAYPFKKEYGIGCEVAGLQEHIVGEARRALLVLLGAVGCVLLIACANVANLLLARAAGRAQEIALRRALGASRWRVIRFLLTESVLLALIGGALGLAGAYWLVHGFVAFDPIRLPRVQEIAIDRGVLLLAFLACVLTGVLFGLAPALRLSRPDLNKVLKEGAASAVAGPLRSNRGRAALAAAQMALTLMLLTGAGLLLRSFVLRVSVPLGFRPEGALGIELPWAAHRRIDEVLERLRALPGILAAGAGTAFPHEPAGSSGGFEIEARPKRPAEELRAGKFVVTPEYFRAAGMTLRKGRWITRDDGMTAPKAAVINAALARRYFPDQDPIGKRVQEGDGIWWPIVGVVGDVKGFGVSGDPMPAIYWSHKQRSWNNGVSVLVRTAVPPASVAGAVRNEIRTLNRSWIAKIATIEDLLSASVAVPRFYMLLVVGFAALALSVAVVGVYGTINYSVAQRRHEIGVRMALGAARGDILHLVVRQGFAVILVGAIIGLAGAWASTRVLESLLFGVRPGDAAAFAGAAVVLVAAGLLACWVPARRATRIDPMKALRYE